MNMKLHLSLLALISMTSLSSYCQTVGSDVFSNDSIENSQSYVLGNDYQKDFLLFISIIQDCHPAFASNYDSPFSIDSIKNSGYKWASTCKSKKDLWCYMQEISSLLNDGHTALIPELNTNLFYPFRCFINKNDIIITEASEEYKSLIGKQIELINGHHIKDIIPYFKKLLSFDNEIDFNKKAADAMQQHSMWSYTPIQSPDSLLHVTFTDNTKASLRAENKRKVWLNLQQTSHFENQTIRKKASSITPFQYTILPDKKLCYLQFDACTDQSTLRLLCLERYPNISKKYLDKIPTPRFDTFLREMFEVVRQNKIEILVVDVRDNYGGNSRLCDLLLSWLKPVRTIKQISSYVRNSELWQHKFPQLSAEAEMKFMEENELFEIGKLYDTRTLSVTKSQSEVVGRINEYFNFNYDESLVFTGDVYFIQNTKTYSAAGMLITTAMDNQIGTIIGDKSSYKPCNYGDMLAWKLPNTGIRGTVSHKIFHRPDIDKCKEVQLSPNITISPTLETILSGRDIYWEWILDNCVQH